MTARAVIEQIKALPPEEQAKVIDFLREVKGVQEVHMTLLHVICDLVETELSADR